MNIETSSKTIKSKVASHVPGRIHLKVHHQSRTRETMETMQNIPYAATRVRSDFFK